VALADGAPIDPPCKITRIDPARVGAEVQWARPADTVAVHTSNGGSRKVYYVAADLRTAAGLRSGDVADRTALMAMQRRSEVLLAGRRGLALLARSMHTRHALALKLRRAGFGTAPVTQALQRLEELGYLDDIGFARLWVRGRVERGGDGRARVLAGLLSRGVSQQDTQAAVAAEYPPEREVEICRELAGRLAQRLPSGDRGGVRLARQLARRGFPDHLVLQALQDLRLADGIADGFDC
jgi:regulatory protein